MVDAVFVDVQISTNVPTVHLVLIAPSVSTRTAVTAASAYWLASVSALASYYYGLVSLAV